MRRTLEPADALAEAARAYEARARECDQTSLAVLDRWQDGKCDRPTFLEEYVEARAAHHEARVLAKLAEIKRTRPPLTRERRGRRCRRGRGRRAATRDEVRAPLFRRRSCRPSPRARPTA